jgi:hypothetical protein
VNATKTDRKLTLSLNGKVIDRAKVYARKHGTSISKLTEKYLAELTEESDEEEEISPLVRSLIGVIKVPDDYDYRQDIYETLMEEYK